MLGEGTSSLRHRDASCSSPKCSTGIGGGEMEMEHLLDGAVMGARISMA